ncbi:hypothetical protein EUX98_g4180 [Antrodiella citrinella]|uniref:Enoyl reductase (ER) domain-containing protein n=1 Tax=Antrodiella citrinella TaxID=2447956 RepID=A0A4S4MUS9_9APHY|nr:hypothetical protein EUX98_g4180 [Antrodiella citrinella]
MAPTQYKQILFNERPADQINATTFRTHLAPFAALVPGDGEVLVQVTYLSLDAAMRAWMRPVKTYVEPLAIGEVMRSGGLGVVLKAGKGVKLREGDLVSGAVGWTEYGVFKESQLRLLQVPTGAEALDFLGALGTTGLTAYFGLIDVGKLKAGDTLLVSGAAGATGSLVCQIGTILGARVIAIAGTAEKCKWLEEELGVETALNYKAADFKERFKKTLGAGFDVYFDNVGGEILDLALTRMKLKARVVMCGAISGYNSKPVGLVNYQTIISQRAELKGFIVYACSSFPHPTRTHTFPVRFRFDYAAQYPAALADLGKWLAEGKLKRKFHVVQGIEKAGEALPLLYSGGNIGKLYVSFPSLSPLLTAY